MNLTCPRLPGLLLACALSLPLPAAQAEDDIEGSIMNLDELKGKERVDAIEKLCGEKDPDAAAALVPVLAEPKDSDTPEILAKVFEALLRLQNKGIRDELDLLMDSQDPIIQGYGFRIYARTFRDKAGKKLLPYLAKAQGTARTDLMVVLRDCPDPAVLAELRRLAANEKDLQLMITLLRLGDPQFSKEVVQGYGDASDEIRALTEALVYPSDRKKAARDQARKQEVIRFKAELRTELTQIPPSSIRGFAEGAATSQHADVWSLLAWLLPRLFKEDTLPAFAPLLASPSMEVTTIVLDALAASPKPEALAPLPEAIDRLANSPFPELRKEAARASGVLPREKGTALARRLLDDPDKWVRIEAMEKLAEWKVADARPNIGSILEKTEDPDVRWSARYALQQLP